MEETALCFLEKISQDLTITFTKTVGNAAKERTVLMNKAWVETKTMKTTQLEDGVTCPSF